MLDKELFRKTEGKLYRYYRFKREIESITNRIECLETRLKTIESDIKTTNVTIDYYQNGIGISERVQTSSKGTSYAEEEIIKEIGKLEREHCNKTKQLMKARVKLRDMEEFTSYMEFNINMLNEEDKRFIELKYGDEINMPEVATRLNISQATAYRKREELVKNIAQFESVIK
ncbi:transcriptional regulator [uncultured Clostridium sp.]|jgi:DNA-directed RNA polymerase specialized sigma subunit|uniref:transcriptional regulator n=1 Tax=uncultured Clostridium sp. TaxID=59620 RepID=UPI003217D5A2